MEKEKREEEEELGMGLPSRPPQAAGQGSMAWSPWAVLVHAPTAHRVPRPPRCTPHAPPDPRRASSCL
eukprot:9339700-Pyramimonas_sp.AAC.1